MSSMPSSENSPPIRIFLIHSGSSETKGRTPAQWRGSRAAVGDVAIGSSSGGGTKRTLRGPPSPVKRLTAPERHAISDYWSHPHRAPVPSPYVGRDRVGGQQRKESPWPSG